MSWYSYPKYESVGSKRVKAEKKLAQLKKKNPNISPVVIEGRKIAKTWWGISWCKNLESYADYVNRIGRGRSYVTNGFVLDLQIEEGIITAQVFGSSSSLYTIEISIDPLSEENKALTVKSVGQQIDSIEDLINGNFPEKFGDIFLTQRKGLFPSPDEINVKCSCPDWATMCKHVAAVLYGVGARLDTDPMMFFLLRGVDVGAFIKKSVEEKMNNMLENAGSSSERILDTQDLEGLFNL